MKRPAPDNFDEPVPVDASGSQNYNAPILQVFTTRDLVVHKLAPLLDLLTLFNLSRVNRRLHELLSQTNTLQTVLKYKGNAASDLPGTFLEYPDERITAYMTTRRKRYSLAKHDPYLPFGFDYIVPWEVVSVFARVAHRDMRANIIEHYLKELVFPFVRDSKLPDEQLTKHLELLYPALFRPAFTEFRFRQRVSDETCELLRLLIIMVARRVQGADLVMWHCDLYRDTVARETGTYPIGVYDIALLHAQGGGNKVVREAMSGCIRQLGMSPRVGKMTLLLAATGSNPAYFDAEYVRLGKCVSTIELLICSSFWESEDMFFHILDTLGSKKILEQAWITLRTFSREVTESDAPEINGSDINGADIAAMYSLVRTIEMGKRGIALTEVMSVLEAALDGPVNPEAVRSKFLVALVEWSGGDPTDRDTLTEMDKKMNSM